MAYRRFSALADALESEHRGGGYAIYYETLSGSISPEEAANLAKMGFEIGPGRLREPRASATVATVKVMSAGEI